MSAIVLAMSSLQAAYDMQVVMQSRLGSKGTKAENIELAWKNSSLEGLNWGVECGRWDSAGYASTRTSCQGNEEFLGSGMYITLYNSFTNEFGFYIFYININASWKWAPSRISRFLRAFLLAWTFVLTAWKAETSRFRGKEMQVHSLLQVCQINDDVQSSAHREKKKQTY